jgi:two-component system nitrogen regulation sensor histidine kinase NtrY
MRALTQSQSLARAALPLGERLTTRTARNLLTLALVALGPVLVILTFATLNLRIDGGDLDVLRLVLLADLVYVLTVATLVIRNVTRLIAARRARSAGSELHLRLSGIFTLVALVPTVLVAIFATVTINLGLEGWFSDRVRSALGNSVEAAQAYAQEHRDDLVTDARGLGAYLDSARRSAFLMSDGDLRQVLSQGQDFIQRGLEEAFVIDGGGGIRARGDRSYLFDYEPVTARQIARARAGDVVLVEDDAADEFRALLRLSAFPDRYLYVTREVDGEILALLDETEATARLYHQLEEDRGRLLFEFGLLYLGFAVILVLAATWLGLWFAEALSRPVGRLAGAAQRVGQGDLDVRVRDDGGDDEIAMLGRIFNQMTRQLKGQRDALVDTHGQTEARRRLFDSVLGSVTAGVIGLDADGRVDFANRSAQRLLDADERSAIGRDLPDLVPEFAALFDRLRSTRAEAVQEELRIVRGKRLENLLVRIATRRSLAGELEGYVVAFDDVTELVSAQRMAAWGDVARRIAHEIKNPLTPIQLSAERMKRRFARQLEEEEAAKLGEMSDVIVRQTGDLRRIVDEFSRFARMPEPDRRRTDLAALVREAATLQRPALEPATLEEEVPAEPVLAMLDAGQIGQALTNLIKNAGEAVEARMERGDAFDPRVSVSLRVEEGGAVLRIADTGVGLPSDRTRLFEPYVTTREKGTGLGLSIVKKIIEEHGGTLSLEDAAPEEGGHRGAEAVIRLPLLSEGDEQ